jgi:hypothetical protein
MMRKLCGKTIRLVALLAVFSLVLQVRAHHSFSMFDQSKSVTVTGSVTKFEWTNPHVYIHVGVPDAKDAKVVKEWTIELGSPSILQQGGWKFSDVKVGDKITASLSPLRDGTTGGLLTQVTLASGKVLGNGPGRGPQTPARGAQPAPARGDAK